MVFVDRRRRIWTREGKTANCTMDGKEHSDIQGMLLVSVFRLWKNGASGLVSKQKCLREGSESQSLIVHKGQANTFNQSEVQDLSFCFAAPLHPFPLHFILIVDLFLNAVD